MQKAGSLLSLPSAYNSDTDLASHQIYIPFDVDEIWRRGKRNGGRWTDWTKITVSPAELEEAVRTAAGQAVLLTGAQTARGVKTFSDGLKTATPAATSNDTSVATTAFVNRAVGGVMRKTGSLTLGQGNLRMDCDWQSATYPDGRIVQRYHIKHASYINFPPEEDNVNATHPGGRGVTATLPLAAAMPNAVFEVRVQVVRATKADQSSTYNNEAAELAAAWNLRRQGSEKDKVYIDIARARGSEHEHIDILDYVEGY